MKKSNRMIIKFILQLICTGGAIIFYLPLQICNFIGYCLMKFFYLVDGIKDDFNEENDEKVYVFVLCKRFIKLLLKLLDTIFMIITVIFKNIFNFLFDSSIKGADYFVKDINIESENDNELFLFIEKLKNKRKYT